MYCQNCGSKRQTREKFCRKCGAPITEAPAVGDNVLSTRVNPWQPALILTWLGGFFILLKIVIEFIFEFVVYTIPLDIVVENPIYIKSYLCTGLDFVWRVLIVASAIFAAYLTKNLYKKTAPHFIGIQMGASWFLILGLMLLFFRRSFGLGFGEWELVLSIIGVALMTFGTAINVHAISKNEGICGIYKVIKWASIFVLIMGVPAVLWRIAVEFIHS